MRFNGILVKINCVLSSIIMSACIMTKNPQYQNNQNTVSYLDTRYDEIIHLNVQKKLLSKDVDEAYLLSTIYFEKKQFPEAKNLLKIVFDSQKTLTAGLAYIDVLNQLGENKEADNIHKFLSVLYDENEIKDQNKILKNF